jgi:hypothetical protein
MRPILESKVQGPVKKIISHMDGKATLDVIKALEEKGNSPEKVIALFYDEISGLKTILLTPDKDKGVKSKGQQVTDLVVYFNDYEPAFTVQIVKSNENREKVKETLRGVADNPFIRLDGTTLAIPKVLVYLDEDQIKNFFENPKKPDQYPKLYLKFIDDHIKSLNFDLFKTKNPLEQEEIKKLIEIFTKEKEKYTSS